MDADGLDGEEGFSISQFDVFVLPSESAGLGGAAGGRFWGGRALRVRWGNLIPLVRASCDQVELFLARERWGCAGRLCVGASVGWWADDAMRIFGAFFHSF